jgi:hypothetical protein
VTGVFRKLLEISRFSHLQNQYSWVQLPSGAPKIQQARLLSCVESMPSKRARAVMQTAESGLARRQVSVTNLFTTSTLLSPIAIVSAVEN